MECEICFNAYSCDETSEHTPIRTNCSHLFCRQCAENIMKVELETRIGRVKNVKCPTCNKRTVPVNPIEVNYGVLQMLRTHYDKLQQQEKNQQQQAQAQPPSFEGPAIYKNNNEESSYPLKPSPLLSPVKKDGIISYTDIVDNKDDKLQQQKQNQQQQAQAQPPSFEGPAIYKNNNEESSYPLKPSPLLSPVKKEDITDTDLVDTDIVYTDIVDTDIVDTVNLPLLYETDAEAQDSPLLSTENNINNNNDDNDNGNNSRKRRRKSPSTIIINTNTTKVIGKEKIKLDKDDVYCIECVLVVPLNNNQHSCILTGNRNGDIHIYNNKYKLAQQIIKAHNSSIAKFLIIDDKQHTIASTAESSLVQIWKLRADYDGNNKNLLQKHKKFECNWNVSEITSFQNILLCGGERGEIELWNYNDTTTSITSINNDNNHNSEIRALHMFYNINSNKPSLVSCDVVGNVKLWETNDPVVDDDDDDIKNMTFIKSMKYKRAVYSSCTLEINNNDNNTLIAFATAKEGIQILCGSSLDTYHTFPDMKSIMRGIHCMRSFVSQDGKNMIAAVNDKGYFLIFNISDKKIDSTMVVDSDLKFTTMDIDQLNKNFICGGYHGKRNVGTIVTIS